jgi:hypothetical protein
MSNGDDQKDEAFGTHMPTKKKSKRKTAKKGSKKKAASKGTKKKAAKKR